MPIKTTTRHQIPSDKMVILTVCKQQMGERAGEDGTPPIHVLWEGTLAIAPRKSSVHWPEQKISRDLSLGFSTQF